MSTNQLEQPHIETEVVINCTPNVEPASDDEELDTRFEWVPRLKKNDLKLELEKYKLNSEGKVPELKFRLLNFFINGRTERHYTAPQAKNVLNDQPEVDLVPSTRKNSSVWSERTIVLDKVRSWNLRFDGLSDPETFVERLAELQESYELSDEQLFKSIPELLTKNALLWYRNNRRDFNNWEEFTEAFEQYYFPTDFKEKLEVRIHGREQRIKEKGREYLTEIQTLIRRHGGYNRQSELNLLYSNLRPEYRQYIRRKDFSTITELLNHVDEYEKLQDEMSKETPTKTPLSTEEKGRKNKKDEHQPAKITTNNVNDYPRKPITCFRCGKEGHYSRECTKPRQNTGNENRVVESKGTSNQQ